MKRSPDNQINTFSHWHLENEIASFFYYGRLSSAQLDRWQAPTQQPIIDQRPIEQTAYWREIKDHGYKSVLAGSSKEQVFLWSVVVERSSALDSSSDVVRMWVRILAWPVAVLVSLSKTLNHNCFALRMGRKAVGPVCCVMHVKEPRTFIVKEKGLAPVFLDSRLEHPAGWICARYKSSVLLLLLFLGKNPQKSELVHCLQCLLIRGHRTVTPWTPRNNCMYTSQAPRWHAMRGVLTKHTKIGMRA